MKVVQAKHETEDELLIEFIGDDGSPGGSWRFGISIEKNDLKESSFYFVDKKRYKEDEDFSGAEILKPEILDLFIPHINGKIRNFF